MKEGFIKPRLYDSKWFVYYYKNGKRIRISKGINKHSTAKKRIKASKIIIEYILKCEKLSYKSKEKRFVDEYLEHKKGVWQKKTFEGHKSIIKTFFFWLGFDDLNNENIRRFFLELMGKRSRTTYKNYKQVLGQLIPEALNLTKDEKEALFLGVQSLRTNPVPPNVYSLSNMKRLKEVISKEHAVLWMVCQLQYYCFIRPGREIRNLKVGDIDLDECHIIVHASSAKSKKTKYPVIPPAFLPHIKKHIEGKHLGEYICPSPMGPRIMASPNHYAKAHRRFLKKVGLPYLRYKLYGWKPTGMLQAKKNGASMKYLKEQAGHASIDETDSYLRSVGWKDDDNSSILVPEI